MRTTERLVQIGILALVAVLLQACAAQFGSSRGEEQANEQIDEPTIKHIYPGEPALAASRSRSAQRAELVARNATGLPSGALADVLFDFDQASIRLDALPVLQANARRLMAQGAGRLLLEGRGDEIGTAAYNLVLGDRRAKRVKSYLQDLGLEVELRTTSYGKDRPLCFQHSSECLQRNRSVHFVVKE